MHRWLSEIKNCTWNRDEQKNNDNKIIIGRNERNDDDSDGGGEMSPRYSWGEKVGSGARKGKRGGGEKKDRERQWPWLLTRRTHLSHEGIDFQSSSGLGRPKLAVGRGKGRGEGELV